MKKRSTISTGQSLLETDCLEEPFYTKESPGLVRRKTKGIRPILTPRHSERALLTDSTSSSNKSDKAQGKLSGIVSWFRGSKSKTSIDIESAAFPPELSASFSQKGYLSATTIRGRSSDAFGRSLFRAKRRFERKFGRFGIGKGKKNTQNGEDSSGNCKKILLSFKFKFFK